jgi:hypothetical protein
MELVKRAASLVKRQMAVAIRADEIRFTNYELRE